VFAFVWQELFDHARLEHARGEHHTPHHARWERWLCNACIGIACGLTSFFLKMCIEFLANTRYQKGKGPREKRN